MWLLTNSGTNTGQTTMQTFSNKSCFNTQLAAVLLDKEVLRHQAIDEQRRVKNTWGDQETNSFFKLDPQLPEL